MKWGIYLGFFGLSTVKFMFTPFGGPAAGLTFIETYISCTAGAILSATAFYYLAEYFLLRAREKSLAAIDLAKKTGEPIKQKKKFTKMNKFVVGLKHRFGIYGISLFAPFVLSIPLGSIITAKFYGKEKKTYPLILIGIVGNGLLTTSLAYFAQSLF